MEPEDKKFAVRMCLLGALVLVLVAAIIAVVAVLDPPAEYSVAVTSLLDDGAAAPALFELTVRIKNRSRLFSVCVNAGATAAVSRNGTAVAAGAVPPFCAGRRRRREAAAPLRGVDGDGAAALVVDVVVRVPHVHLEGRVDYVQDRTLACRGVRVGGGLYPCTSSDP